VVCPIETRGAEVHSARVANLKYTTRIMAAHRALVMKDVS